MPDQSEIAAAAKQMLHRFGEKALAEAELRVDELRSHHETSAMQFWLAVSRELELLSGADKLKRQA